MTATDVEVSRALNALITTLNDQRPPGADVVHWQSIVIGALGGERHIAAHRESGDPPAGSLREGGTVLARFHRVGDRWIGERVAGPLSDVAIPR